MIEKLTLDWGESDKAPNERKRWLGSWLVSRDGEEGEYFYDGPGGQKTTHDVPTEAIGLRLRWWPPDSQVDLNLEFGPLPTLAEDFFFPETLERTLAVSAFSLLR